MTIRSAGFYGLEINIYHGDNPVPDNEVRYRPLVRQLRELADALDEDDYTPRPGELRYVKGTNQLDEIILSNVDVHIEQMDNDVYWMCFTQHGDKTYKRLVVDITHDETVKRRAPLNGYVTENDLNVKEAR